MFPRNSVKWCAKKFWLLLPNQQPRVYKSHHIKRCEQWIKLVIYKGRIRKSISTHFIRLWNFFKKNAKHGLLSCHSRNACATQQGFHHRFWGNKRFATLRLGWTCPWSWIEQDVWLLESIYRGGHGPCACALVPIISPWQGTWSSFRPSPGGRSWPGRSSPARWSSLHSGPQPPPPNNTSHSSSLMGAERPGYWVSTLYSISNISMPGITQGGTEAPWHFK